MQASKSGDSGSHPRRAEWLAVRPHAIWHAITEALRSSKWATTLVDRWFGFLRWLVVYSIAIPAAMYLAEVVCAPFCGNVQMFGVDRIRWLVWRLLPSRLDYSQAWNLAGAIGDAKKIVTYGGLGLLLLVSRSTFHDMLEAKKRQRLELGRVETGEYREYFKWGKDWYSLVSGLAVLTYVVLCARQLLRQVLGPIGNGLFAPDHPCLGWHGSLAVVLYRLPALFSLPVGAGAVFLLGGHVRYVAEQPRRRGLKTDWWGAAGATVMAPALLAFALVAVQWALGDSTTNLWTRARIPAIVLSLVLAAWLLWAVAELMRKKPRIVGKHTRRITILIRTVAGFGVTSVAILSTVHAAASGLRSWAIHGQGDLLALYQQAKLMNRMGEFCSWNMERRRELLEYADTALTACHPSLPTDSLLTAWKAAWKARRKSLDDIASVPELPSEASVRQYLKFWLAIRATAIYQRVGDRIRDLTSADSTFIWATAESTLAKGLQDSDNIKERSYALLLKPAYLSFSPEFVDASRPHALHAIAEDLCRWKQPLLTATELGGSAPELRAASLRVYMHVLAWPALSDSLCTTHR